MALMSGGNGNNSDSDGNSDHGSSNNKSSSSGLVGYWLQARGWRRNKKALKSSDIVTQELKEGFSWTIEHGKLVAFLSVAFVVAGLSYSGWDYYQKQGEEKLQEKFFQLEKIRTDLGKSLETSPGDKPEEKGSSGEGAMKGKNEVHNSKDNKLMVEKLSKDLEVLIDEAPSTRAARLSAFSLLSLHRENKVGPGESLRVINKLDLGRDELSQFLRFMKGGLQGQMNDCAGALVTWERVLRDDRMLFLRSDLKNQMGICYEILKQPQKAQEMYTQAAADARLEEQQAANASGDHGGGKTSPMNLGRRGGGRLGPGSGGIAEKFLRTLRYSPLPTSEQGALKGSREPVEKGK